MTTTLVARRLLGQPRSAPRTARLGALGRAARPTAGFTIVELMITISISVILFTVGIPGFSAMIKNQVLSTEARTFSMSLALARSQARSRKTPVTLCKSADGTSCSTLEANNWEDGWILFVDVNADGALQSGDIVLRRSQDQSDSVTLRASDEFGNYIAFGPDGRAFGSGDDTPPTNGQYRFCDSRGPQHARVIEISPIGRARVLSEPGARACP